jgi:plasmid stabilization system protein ParE
MVKRIVWTKRASIKFNRVIQYLETKWGNAVTENFVKQTYSIIDLLAEQPALGTIEIQEKEIRAFLITKHNRIFYRYTSDELVILNFFDTRQHPDKKKY